MPRPLLAMILMIASWPALAADNPPRGQAAKKDPVVGCWSDGDEYCPSCLEFKDGGAIKATCGGGGVIPAVIDGRPLTHWRRLDDTHIELTGTSDRKKDVMVRYETVFGKDGTLTLKGDGKSNRVTYYAVEEK